MKKYAFRDWLLILIGALCVLICFSSSIIADQLIREVMFYGGWLIAAIIWLYLIVTPILRRKEIIAEDDEYRESLKSTPPWKRPPPDS
ncbi:hypothetical protein [Mariprofundus micogutta]|uniref:hypothetical protein n=1 Tax=Mariprofundus micogutta TaxID=1921010 RepID=UPI0011602856|nr:hypothetical protein [Mariprofundus micogutta]